MSVLDKIFETKRREIAEAKAAVPQAEVERLAAHAPATRGFRRALAESSKMPALIAEVKKASPSQGLIRPDFDPAGIARTYERAGAQALSVLTDRNYFQGALEYLVEARSACSLPVLRKDFICDPYQVFEARAHGADAVLLIVASLEPKLLAELQALARSLGMDALVEVHTAEEAEVAVNVKADLIGINNRNLADFTTSLSVTENLAPRLAASALVVAESALSSNEDVQRVAKAGATAVLIGTVFCASPDIEAKVGEVMGR